MIFTFPCIFISKNISPKVSQYRFSFTIACEQEYRKSQMHLTISYKSDSTKTRKGLIINNQTATKKLLYKFSQHIAPGHFSSLIVTHETLISLYITPPEYKCLRACVFAHLKGDGILKTLSFRLLLDFCFSGQRRVAHPKNEPNVNSKQG